MKIGSLFSGIGGLELGLEWAGVGRTAWQVEQDLFCQAVLAHHWPDAKRYNDVREVGAHNLEPVDVICGGFPCQDISYAGKGAGLAGARSGLWYEFARIIGELGPQYVVVENVAALFTRGIDAVLGTLADLGFDAECSTVSAAAVGAPHRRERVFIVAYRNGWRREWERQPITGVVRSASGDVVDGCGAGVLGTGAGQGLADAQRAERRALAEAGNDERDRDDVGRAEATSRHTRHAAPACAEVVGRRLLEIAARECQKVAG
jgi:DNA (cytosine-5)-methyltransferase 1